MAIFLWVLGIHSFEIVAFLFYRLINKNAKLEKAINYYQKQSEAVSYTLSQFSIALNQVDDKIWIADDPELKEVFEKLKELQNIIEVIE